MEVWIYNILLLFHRCKLQLQFLLTNGLNLFIPLIDIIGLDSQQFLFSHFCDTKVCSNKVPKWFYQCIYNQNFIMKTQTIESTKAIMDSQAFAHPPPSPSLISNVTTISLVLTASFAIVAFCFLCTIIIALIHTTVGMLFSCLLFDMHDRHIDLEAGQRRHQTRILSAISQQTPFRNNIAFFQALLVEVWDRVNIDEEGTEEQQRQVALESLPPPISYRNLDVSSSPHECVICLEDFEDGDSCRVFSVCKHIFHLNCVDNWLRKNLTCPICRKYVIDV